MVKIFKSKKDKIRKRLLDEMARKVTNGENPEEVFAWYISEVEKQLNEHWHLVILKKEEEKTRKYIS